MSVGAILLPVFVQVGLVVALLAVTARRRYLAVQAGQVRREEVILGQRNWPERSQAASNAFSHQFEVPVLFYALVAFAMITRKADLLFVVMSWVFVATRIVHAAVYVTTNHLPHRLGAFAAGFAVLIVMWIVFAVRILVAAPLV